MNIERIQINEANYSQETTNKSGFVMHWMSGYLNGSTASFQDPSRRASAHYGISDNRVVEWVPPEMVAWHAANRNANRNYIGIEHEGGYNGAVPTRKVCDNSIELITMLCRRYNIDHLEYKKNIFRHKDFSNTDCCGSLDIDYIINGVNNNLNNIKPVIQDDMSAAERTELNQLRQQTIQSEYNRIYTLPDKVRLYSSPERPIIDKETARILLEKLNNKEKYYSSDSNENADWVINQIVYYLGDDNINYRKALQETQSKRDSLQHDLDVAKKALEGLQTQATELKKNYDQENSLIQEKETQIQNLEQKVPIQVTPEPLSSKLIQAKKDLTESFGVVSTFFGGLSASTAVSLAQDAAQVTSTQDLINLSPKFVAVIGGLIATFLTKRGENKNQGQLIQATTIEKVNNQNQ